MVPDTAFMTLEFNFEDHPDHVPGVEYVMIQRFVNGVSLAQAAERYGGDCFERR